MHQNDAIGQNELVVNDLLIRINKVVLLLLPVLFILKAVGLFAASWMFVTAVVVIGIAVCLIPIIYRQLRIDVKNQKDINVVCSVILVIIAYSLFHLNVVLLWLVPICFSCLYFDMKLIKRAAVLTIPALAAGEFFHAYFNLSIAVNEYAVYFRSAALAVQILMLAALFISIAQRAEKMLQGTHGFYENINDLFSNAYAASESLQLSGEKLVKGLETLKEEHAEGDGIDSDEAESEEGPAGMMGVDSGASGGSVGRLVSNLNRTMENAREIMKYTCAMTQVNPQEEKAGSDIRSDWSHIEEYTRKSKQVLAELAGYTEKIKEDLGMIAVVIEESRLLSVNATKEMEEASEGGDGSAILGMKIGELADESVKSAAHIQQALNGIVQDAEKTITSITETYEETIKQLEMINRTVETLMKWVMYKNMH